MPLLTPPAPRVTDANVSRRAWLAGLAPRDRLIYGALLTTLGIIAATYIGLALVSVFAPAPDANQPTPTAATAASTAAVVVALPSSTAAALATPTLPPPAVTPTNLPTRTLQPSPTTAPTQAPAILLPTRTDAACCVATAIPLAATITTRPTRQIAATQVASTLPSTVVSTITQPAATLRATAALPPTRAPATRVPATRVPATRAPVVPLPTAIPATAVPPVAKPVRTERLWLYFGDVTGSLFVAVQRNVRIEGGEIAAAAVRELIAGPRGGLQPVLDSQAQLRSVRIADGIAFVDFDRDPARGDSRGLQALALTLTHYSAIRQVQVQVNGSDLNLGNLGALDRPIINPLNPSGLPFDFRATEFLPLYFPSVDGQHTVRVIRMVPKTRQTATETIAALLEGPGEYSYAVRRVIPSDTTLLGLTIDDGIATINLSEGFAGAEDRGAAARSIVQSLTTLPQIRGTRLLVEGVSLAERWGGEFGIVFERPLINPEG